MPVWCFHGAQDDVVPISSSEKMVEALREFNPDVRFTVYPEARHDSWTETYNNPEIYEWLLSHRRTPYEQVTLPEELMREYEGDYRDQAGNTLTLQARDGELVVFYEGEPERNTLKPYRKDHFFRSPRSASFSRLGRDGDGRITDLTFYWPKIKQELRRVE